jgi:hypothetical protein
MRATTRLREPSPAWGPELGRESRPYEADFREAAANLLTSPVLEPHAKMAALKVCAVRIEPAKAGAAV